MALILHYKFEEESGSTVSDEQDNYDGIIRDKTGNVINTSLVHNTDGIDGNCFKFTENAWIDIGGTPLNDANATAMSISAWIYIKTTDIEDGKYTVIADSNRGSGGQGFYLLADRRSSDNHSYNGIKGYVESIDGTYTLTLDDVFSTTSSWYHVVMTYSSSAYKLYINGNEKIVNYPNEGGGNFVPSSTINTAFAGLAEHAGGFFQGKLDDVRIYNHELSQSEVTDLYFWGGGADTSPLAGTIKCKKITTYNDKALETKINTWLLNNSEVTINDIEFINTGVLIAYIYYE